MRHPESPDGTSVYRFFFGDRDPQGQAVSLVEMRFGTHAEPVRGIDGKAISPFRMVIRAMEIREGTFRVAGRNETVYFVGPAETIQRAVAAVHNAVAHTLGNKPATHANDVAWWSLREHVMWTCGHQAASDLCRGLGLELLGPIPG